MKFEFDQNELRPLIKEIVEEVIAQQSGVSDHAANGRDITMTEAQAAESMNLKCKVLGDRRRDGDFDGCYRRVGRRYLWYREALENFFKNGSE